MNKKVCLNLLLSSNTDDPISLASLSSVSIFSNEAHLKPTPDIIGKIYPDLENKALKKESVDPVQAYNLWLKSIALKLSYFKSHTDKVRLK
jgi:hypothetical protein